MKLIIMTLLLTSSISYADQQERNTQTEILEQSYRETVDKMRKSKLERLKQLKALEIKKRKLGAKREAAQN